MRHDVLNLLACPYCSGRLRREEEADGRLVAFVCQSQGHTIPIHGDIADFVREDRLERVNAFAASFSEVWRRDGWGGSDPSYLLALPYRDRTGRRSAEWKVKARSMKALLRELGAGAGRRAIDLGAGIGWLSHHLALRGFDVYAIDVVTDDEMGLGAASTYLRDGPSFERIRAELESPPFQPGSMEIAICNASLHYADNLSLAVSRIARILAPGGLFVVMNSPVHLEHASALRAQAGFRARLRRLGAADQVADTYHHLSRGELEDLLAEHFATVREIPFHPGVRFTWSRVAKSLLLRMELASFPIFVAAKTPPNHPGPSGRSNRRVTNRVWSPKDRNP